MMIPSAVLGFPRIGPHRELKKVVELYWAGKVGHGELQASASTIRVQRWLSLHARGVTIIPSGEFSLYDHVLDHCCMMNIIPDRYTKNDLSMTDMYFAMGRGLQDGKRGIDLPAMEMKKWFDTNYHFIVPEVSSSTQFKLNYNQALNEFLEARTLGVSTRPVLLGPVTLLALSKPSHDDPSYDPLQALDKLLPVYVEILSQLKQAGSESVQIDEPILVLDRAAGLEDVFRSTYATLARESPKIVLTTYFGRLGQALTYVKDLPVWGLHVDLSERGDASQLEEVVQALVPTPLVLSLGLISGRNVWKADLATSLEKVRYTVQHLGAERVIVATSSSLLHIPVTLASEDRLSSTQLDWLAFALEKASEVVTLARIATAAPAAATRDDGCNNDDQQAATYFVANQESIARRREFEAKSDPAVRHRLAMVTPAMYARTSPFPIRKETQQKLMNLPPFPTTTIGSFPQTSQIRLARSHHNDGRLSLAQYEGMMEGEIERVIRFQESIDLDILVHGEPERNDMVQYFAEQLNGFLFTQNGWVQSYGSRCVRPPIISSDVSRPGPMTVRWARYAQSLTPKPVKGMLTGPVTILNWSYPRIDVSREVQAKQIALALRDEVIDLEAAGIRAIQVDEPAIREGLPLRNVDWDAYLTWAVESFRLATSAVEDSTMIASHFCYSDFNDIFSSIKRLDADSISIEASKSDMKLLNVFQTQQYSSGIGPGVYDIHSPRVPSQEEIQARISSMLSYIPSSLLEVNPDCGLKTRAWKETEEALKNMVRAAQWARRTYVSNIAK
eukprot:TRINITY_DN7290_c0_g1_i1.p1 TRINITY_DN7290_c0_g1~~TRINITY_DN7290_c0_g1_i1.p1  ORF type:complete len:787 (-),score=200.23 TRINITY_DN7290_c0_g1_i1:108-2468(-)